MASALADISDQYDVIIIGAGIAGASLAYFLAARGVSRVLVVERESHPAYHATGRSAASVVEIDGNPVVQDLKVLGAAFLRDPPSGFSDHALIERRGVLVLLDVERWKRMRGEADGLRRMGMPVKLLTPRQANALIDGRLQTSQFAGAALLDEDGFIDVHELLGCYMRHAQRAGIVFRYDVDAVPEVAGGVCVGVRIGARLVRAGVVANAAGAWAGRVAAAAGASPLAIVPRRRSIVVLDFPEAIDPRQWPMVWCDALRIYFRDDAGRLLLCPMDETEMEPCDASWDEEIIAAGIERLVHLAPSLRPRAILHRWAGLRTFATDGAPLVGYDPVRPGFFWLAGQGGCGIETSGALGAIAADLLVERQTARFDATRLAPGRMIIL